MANTTANLFAQLLTEAIYHIRHHESKNVQTVQDELGYALGKRGGSSIEYWRKGYLPAKPADLENLTRLVVQRGGFSADWAAKFLASAGHPYPASFLGQLFPVDTAVSPTPNGSNRTLFSTNLLSQPTPFLGRKQELDAILKQLDDSDCRLLTLVGPGGIGKTRLAIEAAQQKVQIFPDGVFFVSLDTINSPELILAHIANAIYLPLVEGISPKMQLLNFLQDKRLLLIMDNFEHLIAEAPLVAEIIGQAPEVQVIITSRERLNLRGEWIFEVKGMQFPAKHLRPSLSKPTAAEQDFEKYSAVQLFVQSARRIRSDFVVTGANIPHIVRICQLVEGFPLAIELAATWVRILSCADIAQEIERNYEFLATNWRDIPPRHRSLQAVFDYSWALLSPTERDVLVRLSVFQGAFNREALTAVAAVSLDVLGSLVDKSFLQVGKIVQGETAVTCYEMHELIRFYAAEKLNNHG